MRGKMIIFTFITVFFVNSVNPWVDSFGTAFAEDLKIFRQALPGYKYKFPRDFYSHDNFRIEWWYYTGNLKSEDESRFFGYQLTFFRVALDGKNQISNPSQWKVDHIYFAHMTLTDITGEKFHYFERISRKGIGNAGADSNRLMVWNEDWFLTDKNNAHNLKAVELGTGIDLRLVPVKGVVVHGKNGISRKGSEQGNASHYFSYTHMKTTGTVFLKGRSFKVFGTSWMDREYSSNQLNKNLSGWDWFSIKLDNNVELMLYQLRRKTGEADPYSSGSIVLSDGRSRHIKKGDFTITPMGKWTSKKSNITYPAGWIIELPDSDTELTLLPDLPDQELYNLRSIYTSYWEGSVSIKGTVSGKKIKGKGYVELVGYGKALEQALPDE